MPHALSSIRCTLSLAAALLLPAAPVLAFSVSIDSTGSSFLNDAGNGLYDHGSTIQNYQVGYNKTEDFTTKNWFVFDLSGIAPGTPITDATLVLYMPSFGAGDPGDGYDSMDPMEDYEIFGLSPGEASFVSGDKIIDGDMTAPEFDAWYVAIGDGPSLGMASVSAADEGGDVAVGFGFDGLAVLDGALGGMFVISGANVSVDYDPILDIEEGYFHHTHPYGVAGPETPAPTLILEIVPEPGTGALLALGLVALGARRRGARR